MPKVTQLVSRRAHWKPARLTPEPVLWTAGPPPAPQGLVCLPLSSKLLRAGTMSKLRVEAATGVLITAWMKEKNKSKSWACTSTWQRPGPSQPSCCSSAPSPPGHPPQAARVTDRPTSQATGFQPSPPLPPPEPLCPRLASHSPAYTSFYNLELDSVRIRRTDRR